MNKRYYLVLAITLIALVLWQWFKAEQLKASIEQIDLPDATSKFQIKQLEMRQYAANGQLLHLIQSDLANSNENIWQLNSPLIKINYNNVEWSLVASKATIEQTSKNVELSQGVTLKNTNKDKPFTLITDNASYNSYAKQLSSLADLYLTGSSSEIKATGFELDLSNESYWLKSDVQGVFY